MELTTQGNNLGWSDSAMFNLNKALEVALTGGICLLTGEKIAPDYGNLETYETFHLHSYQLLLRTAWKMEWMSQQAVQNTIYPEFR